MSSLDRDIFKFLFTIDEGKLDKIVVFVFGIVLKKVPLIIFNNNFKFYEGTPP